MKLTIKSLDLLIVDGKVVRFDFQPGTEFFVPEGDNIRPSRDYDQMPEPTRAGKKAGKRKARRR